MGMVIGSSMGMGVPNILGSQLEVPGILVTLGETTNSVEGCSDLVCTMILNILVYDASQRAAET